MPSIDIFASVVVVKHKHFPICLITLSYYPALVTIHIMPTSICFALMVLIRDWSFLEMPSWIT